MQFTAEHRQLADTVGRFVREELNPHVVAWEAAGRRKCVTMQLENQFLAAVKHGDFVECETEIVRAAKTVIFLRGVLKVQGRAVMASTGIWKVIE